MTLLFSLNEDVTIGTEPVMGVIVGRAEYANADPSYLVRFTDKTSGLPREEWFTESVLTERV